MLFYVLILTLSSGYGDAMTSISGFRTMAACSDAGAAYVRGFNNDNSMRGLQTASFVCIGVN